MLLELVQLGSVVLLEQVKLGSEELLEQVELGSEVLLELVQLGSELLLEQMQLNFSFRNKFIILPPCGLVVDNNTFSKMCVFKSFTGYTDYKPYSKRKIYMLTLGLEPMQFVNEESCHHALTRWPASRCGKQSPFRNIHQWKQS